MFKSIIKLANAKLIQYIDQLWNTTSDESFLSDVELSDIDFKHSTKESENEDDIYIYFL